LRKESKTLNKDHFRLLRDYQDSKEQLKVLNENLKRQTEVGESRERESRSLIDENKTLRVMLEDLKRDASNLKENQNSLIINLRMQLDETREMIDKVKDTKEREFKKLREKCDEEVRRETEKYQFEYDKLREEINMFTRRLGQEESLNKQLAV
jgi:DNA repair exonuclease SbcCD ATPase subunit